MTAYIVTDLSYGDSGKGTTTDFLSRQAATVVVRHNGGPQAGHNVVTADGQHHCFAQFGSGTLAGASTFLSRYMLISPLNMMLEAKHLVQLGQTRIWDRVYVDQEAKIITPYHVALNRTQEQARGADRHGSCGQGIGVTMDQNLRYPRLTVRVSDIGHGRLRGKLELIRKWALREAEATGLVGLSAEWVALCSERVSDDLVRRYEEWLRLVHVVDSGALSGLIARNDQVVFEGAQGVLLDEWRGFHPYTTYSTTTHENALKLLAEARPQTTPVRLGVIRAVTTRHGAGPHPTEDPVAFRGWRETHNPTGAWQGRFRVGHLDLVAHRYAVRACNGVDQIVVTHLDRRSERGWQVARSYQGMDNIQTSRKGDLEFQMRTGRLLAKARPELSRPMSEMELLETIESNLGPIGITSRGPTAEDKKLEM